MDFFGTLYEAFRENWRLAFGVLVIAVVLRFPAAQLISWWNSRKRRSVAQVNEWLGGPLDLSPEMKHHLCAERERWMLSATRGILVNSSMVKALINISEDKLPDGISWEDLRLAQEYLELDNNILIVHFSRYKWFTVGILFVGIIVFLLLYFTFFLLPFTPAEPSNTSNTVSNLISFALAFTCLIPFYFSVSGLRKSWVAYRVKERLETL